MKADQDAKKLRKALSELTAAVRATVKHVDALMARPPTKDRDGDVAKAMNAIEMANDRVRFFVLGEDWRKEVNK